VGTNHISGTADRPRSGELSSPVRVINIMMVVAQLLITPTVHICIQQLGRVKEIVWSPYDAIRNIYHACAEPLRRAGLSAAAETCYIAYRAEKKIEAVAFSEMISNERTANAKQYVQMENVTSIRRYKVVWLRELIFDSNYCIHSASTRPRQLLLNCWILFDLFNLNNSAMAQDALHTVVTRSSAVAEGARDALCQL